MMEKPEPFLPVGQTAVIHLIQRMVLSDRAGGSYLFIGPKGVGKTMAARFFAMAVNCLATSSRPCGHCEACVKILENVHPDLLTLSPEPKKQTISIEQIRQIQETLAFAPYEGKRRLVIIEPADRLGPEAANALLLTLEAPPAHTIFILVTATPYALLDTIRSRCQIIRFSPLTQEALLEVGRHHGLWPWPKCPIPAGGEGEEAVVGAAEVAHQCAQVPRAGHLRYAGQRQKARCQYAGLDQQEHQKRTCQAPCRYLSPAFSEFYVHCIEAQPRHYRQPQTYHEEQALEASRLAEQGKVKVQ